MVEGFPFLLKRLRFEYTALSGGRFLHRAQSRFRFRCGSVCEITPRPRPVNR